MCCAGIIHFLLVTELIFSHNPKANGKTLLGTRMMLTSGLVMTDKNPSSLQHPIQCRPLQNQNPVGNTKPKPVRSVRRSSFYILSSLLPAFQTNHWPVADCTAHLDEQRPPGTYLPREYNVGKKIDKWNKKRVITTSAALHQQLRSVLEAVSLFTSPFIQFLSLLMCLSHSPPPLTENKQRLKISYQ